VSKYVVSSTLQDPQWEHTAVLQGALVDEIQLFADATEVPRLRLVGTRPFRSGIVLLRYRTA
jgi:hypothetical protein